mmetsp:Transcript_5479/g.8548  ORF Transcript_5479/g.8548 Transcript_5479/m.8548 type:complete len:111 (-) Transcript_5479:361-693(-)|eukprot:CAMPEP_0170512050 /NCGR_PEP_ID=MMETSP0208-20121228/66636_1 /TAXON_ID=197538 /ORGANISM="Strombidium inclinatum, Strain S3" /LENGTH=110 /DNA_ID=CAMNT_0010795645 /DNA_START=2218 /DNA_END=2550 /DNA_ORIENTATION=-
MKNIQIKIYQRMRETFNKDVKYYQDKIQNKKSDEEKLKVIDEQLGKEFLYKYLPEKPLEKPDLKVFDEVMKTVNKVRGKDDDWSINAESAVKRKHTELKSEDMASILKTS